MKQKISVGVIGSGWWASINHIPLIANREDAEIVAICSLDDNALRILSDKYSIRSVYKDHREMLRKNNLDAVIVSSPHHLHYGHAKDSLKAGCHVMIEKPMTTDSKTSRDLIALSESEGRHIVLPYGWNFHRITNKARTWLTQGFLGKIRHITLQMASPIHDLLDGQTLASAQNHEIKPNPATWADRSNKTGFGWGQLSHALGLLFTLVDLPPRSIYAATSLSSVGCDFFDAMTLKLSSGVNVVVSGSSISPAQLGFQLDLRIFCEKGVVLLDFEKGRERASFYALDGSSESLPCEEGEGDYSCLEPIDAFINLCKGKKVKNYASGMVGLRAVEVLDGMYRSVEIGNEVQC